MRIPMKITPVRSKARKKELIPVPGWGRIPVKNNVRMAMIVGNRPLHGTRLLVRIAISRSLGESMILHPVTPATLHPNPIIMVKACFPQAWHLAKQQSKLNASLGRYPKSSSRLKRGKKIAMGGSMTPTTHAVTL